MATTGVILNNPWDNKITTQSNEIDNELGFSEAIEKLARKELREDKKTREDSLHQLRDWIKKNQDILNVRTDDKFLLRFLRVKKFSVPMAEQSLLKYLNLKKTFPLLTANLDFLSPTLNKIISNGYIFASPIRDQHQRRVVIAFAKNFDPTIFTSWDMTKAHFLTYETLLEDPETQVVGVTHVGDMQGFSSAHVASWNPTEFARIIKWGEQSLPMRHKSIHCVNVPHTVKFVLDFATTRVSIKMKERFQIHVSPADLHKKIDPACLPLELGGTIPAEEMIELWKRELTAKRDLIIALDKMKILSDQGIIKSDRNNNSNDGISLEGSFRKLEVD